MMSSLLSRPRRVAARICYYSATILMIAGLGFLVATFQHNYWVVAIFSAIFLVILGNTLTHPAMKHAANLDDDDAPLGVLDPQQVRPLEVKPKHS